MDVAPITGVHRIRVGNTVFEGRNTAYLVEDADELALVDTGVATAEAFSTIEAAIEARGHAVADLDRILLTHWHFDHAGLAGRLQAESGAAVHVHDRDAALVAGDAIAELDEKHRRALAEWGVPADARRRLLDYLDDIRDLSGPAPTVDPVASGDRIDLGGVSLEVEATPGHTLGHAVYRVIGERAAFVGDALLPEYTPNVGAADLRVTAPLDTYLATLDRLDALDLDAAYPGHRDTITEPAARIAAVRDHHRARAVEILDVVRAHGPIDAWGVASACFGDLDGIHIRNGPGEVAAHAAVLVDLGAVACRDDGYVLTGLDPRLADAFDREPLRGDG